jgi:hypothetical protein
MVFVGVDLGLTGAISYLKDTGEVSVIDMPVIKIGKRHDYVVASLVGCFIAGGPGPMKDLLVGMEALHAMPSSMCSGVGNYSLGRSSGIFEGILAALNIPYQKIPPQRWKKSLLDGLPKEKGSSVVVAKRLFPGVDLSLKRHHGRADSLLIAEYLRRTCQLGRGEK